MSYIFKISKDNNDRRLDRTLRSEFKWITLGEIMKSIRKGKIKINSNRTREPGVHVFEGDELSVPWQLKSDDKIQIISSRFSSLGRIKIIYKGENVLILNKPSGILVQPDVSGGDSVITRVWGFFGTKQPAAVHRLDRNTTGVLAVALHGDSLRSMEEIFKKRMIKKFYIAIVSGYAPDFIEIDAPLLKDSENNIVKVVKNGAAISAFTKCTRLAGDSEYSLVKIELLTGRTHQARVHMAYIKHPIIGDRKYGIFKDEKNKKISRPLLHAYELEFPSDLSDCLKEVENKKFRAELPFDMQNFIKNRNWKEVNL